MIVRAHHFVMEGYKPMFNDKLVTVWSAPNYCYKWIDSSKYYGFDVENIEQIVSRDCFSWNLFYLIISKNGQCSCDFGAGWESSQRL